MQATITSKGQLTLPKVLRDQLHLQAGDRVEFILGEDNVVTMLPRHATIGLLKGMLPKPEQPVSLADMDRAIADAAVKR
ncbi:MAG: AbrB/MazE/SpoVT family DNA-binding domain-containing protein [Thiohalomonadaceae bacterium]